MSLISSFKGILGETVINVAMWLKLEKEVYHRLNNITLPLSNGGSTQIDHVIVSVYGIFVIETKNYKGWIFGNEKQKQWTQVIMGRKYKFQNPLQQNYLHIKTLADLLELDIRYFHSMIAFIGECELKTRDELPEQVLTSGMVSYIKKKQDKLLDEDEVQAIVKQIDSSRFIKSWRTNRTHKTYLKDKHSNLNTKLKSEIESSDKIKSRKAHKRSDQVQVENPDAFIKQPTSAQLNSDNTIFPTPFEVSEPESKVIASHNVKPNNEALISESIPACPKCQGEMIKRVAKKGIRQGQTFYGCSQFPKCRGVVNVM
ncbi:NERD domain-containing protein [Psychrobacter jeotgali]|uniref:NERD domain-containing protein n=1 Tax=Psychrobacter jeotgali TaxID=179010 RepID=UPI001918EE73|nr:NERD domain-containing protein [Psychrobacter jeotgali]